MRRAEALSDYRQPTPFPIQFRSQFDSQYSDFVDSNVLGSESVACWLASMDMALSAFFPYEGARNNIIWEVAHRAKEEDMLSTSGALQIKKNSRFIP